MKKHAFTLTCALLLSTFAAAHGGMEHIMGTVSALTGNSISVKATDGTTKVVGFDHDTNSCAENRAPPSATFTLATASPSTPTRPVQTCMPPK